MKLNSKNVISIVSIFVITLVMSFSSANVSHAVPAAPSPICAVDAMVLSAKKVKTDIAGSGYPPREDFYYYSVRLKIQNSSVYEQEDDGSCDNLMDFDQNFILHTMEYDETPIKPGQKIDAKVIFGGDEWFHGYFLSDIEIVKHKNIINRCRNLLNKYSRIDALVSNYFTDRGCDNFNY